MIDPSADPRKRSTLASSNEADRSEGLRVERLLIRRGGFELSIDAWSIPRGEITVLLGPTGSGKSTLIESLAGVQNGDKTSIRFSDDPTNATDSLAYRRRVAWVAQRPRLIQGSVRDNVRLGLALRGMQDRERVDRGLETWGLQDLASRSVGRLSGGQIQLVALARAWLCQPDLLLLDEPTSNLDPPKVAKVETLIRQATCESGMGVVWSTHQIFQARRLADRFAFLWDGRIKALGNREQLVPEESPEPLRSYLTGETPA